MWTDIFCIFQTLQEQSSLFLRHMLHDVYDKRAGLLDASTSKWNYQTAKLLSHTLACQDQADLPRYTYISL